MTKYLNRFGFTLDLAVDPEHTYTVSSPRADIGAYLVELTGIMTRIDTYSSRDEPIPDKLQESLEALKAPDDYAADQIKAVLGPVYDQMLADNMPFEVVRTAAATIMVWVNTDMETAREFWDRGGRPVPTNRSQRRRKNSSRGT